MASICELKKSLDEKIKILIEVEEDISIKEDISIIRKRLSVAIGDVAVARRLYEEEMN